MCIFNVLIQLKVSNLHVLYIVKQAMRDINTLPADQNALYRRMFRCL